MEPAIAGKAAPITGPKNITPYPRSFRNTTPKITQDNLIQGCILLPDPPDDTEIEGEKCVLALCVIDDKNDDRVAYPILIKLSQLRYPYEFLSRINSVLTFYGEHLPVPVNVMGRSYNSTMLARAIAYIDA